MNKRLVYVNNIVFLVLNFITVILFPFYISLFNIYDIDEKRNPVALLRYLENLISGLPLLLPILVLIVIILIKLIKSDTLLLDKKYNILILFISLFLVNVFWFLLVPRNISSTINLIHFGLSGAVEFLLFIYMLLFLYMCMNSKKKKIYNNIIFMLVLIITIVLNIKNFPSLLMIILGIYALVVVVTNIILLFKKNKLLYSKNYNLLIGGFNVVGSVYILLKAYLNIMLDYSSAFGYNIFVKLYGFCNYIFMLLVIYYIGIVIYSIKRFVNGRK